MLKYIFFLFSSIYNMKWYDVWKIYFYWVNIQYSLVQIVFDVPELAIFVTSFTVQPQIYQPSIGLSL